MIDKKAVIRVSGIIFLLATFLIIFMSITSIDSAEPNPEPDITRGASWTESCTSDGVYRTCTRTLYSGQMNYHNGTEFTEIDTTIRDNPSEEPLYDYGVQTGAYHAFFKTDPSTAQSVKFYYNHSFMQGNNPHKAGFATFQPHTLNYRNALAQLQQINTIQSVVGYPDSNEFIYPNAFAYGTQLEYQYFQETLKKELVINNLSSLPSLESYMYGGANITLDMDFLIDWKENLDIFVGESQWDSKNELKTREKIEFKLDGETIFYLPKPYAYDSDGDYVESEYTLKKSGSTYYVIVATPYEWMNATGRSYPVYIDPTVVLQDADTENLDDVFVTEDSATNFNTGPYDTQAWVGQGASSFYYSYFKFNISNLLGLGGVNITNANLTLHIYANALGAGESIRLYELVNQSWSEDLINGLTEPSYDLLIEEYDAGNFTGSYFTANVTDWVSNQTTTGNNNISFAFVNGTTVSGSAYVVFNTKEHATSSDRPKLTIDYSYLDETVPVIAWILPTPANNTNQTSTTVYINTTITETNLHHAYLTWDGTNLTMTCANNGTGNYICSYTKTSISDGSYMYSVYAEDNVTNKNQTRQRKVTIDTTAPSIKYTGLTAGNNTEIDHDYVLINISAVDATTGTANLTFRLINITAGGQFVVNTTYVYSFTTTKMLNFTSLPQGYTYLYNVTSTDYLGNKNTTLRRSITLTAGIPVITYVTPTPEDNEKTGTNSVIINMTVAAGADVNNCNLTWQAVNYSMTRIGTGTAVTCNYTMNNLEGTYTFKTAAEDTSGNQGTLGERTITADAAAPRITISTPVNNSKISFPSTPYNLSIKVNWTEPLQASCWYSLNWSGGYVSQNQSFPCTSNTSVSLVSSTRLSYVLVVYSNDTSGNENSVQYHFTAGLQDSGSVSSGAGSTATVIGKGQPIICQADNLTWSINPSTYTLLILPDAKARVAFEFSSDNPVFINLSCTDIVENKSTQICSNVIIEPININLTGNILKSEYVYVTLDLEGTDYDYGDRIFFNILANDGVECILPLSVEARVSWLAFFISPQVWWEKLKASYLWDLSRYNEGATPVKIPLWSVLFVIALTIGLVSTFIWRKSDFKVLYSTLTGIISAIVIFFVLPFPA